MFHFILLVSCDFPTPCYRMLLTDLAEFMASIYHKNDSPYIWIRYKNEANKWKGKPTKYRWENFGEVRQAKLLARKQTEIEQTRAPRGSHQDFDVWVVSWLTSKYGGTNRRTFESYLQTWRPLKGYLAANGLTSPHQIRREFAESYLTARTKKTSRNTAIRDIKIFGMILEEAMQREFITMNPMRRLGLERAPAKHKEVWKDEEIQKVAAALAGTHRVDALRVLFWVVSSVSPAAVSIASLRRGPG